MSLSLSNYPTRANSHFAGKRYGSILVESVWAKPAPPGRAKCTDDYVGVLFDGSVRRLVAYSKMTNAVRHSNPAAAMRSVFNTAYTEAWAEKRSDLVAQQAAVATVQAPPVTQRHADLSVLDADHALDLMTALVKSARKDAKVAAIVKSLSALV